MAFLTNAVLAHLFELSPGGGVGQIGFPVCWACVASIAALPHKTKRATRIAPKVDVRRIAMATTECAVRCTGAPIRLA